MAFSLVQYIRKTYGIGQPPAYDNVADMNAREAAVFSVCKWADLFNEAAPGVPAAGDLITFWDDDASVYATIPWSTITGLSSDAQAAAESTAANALAGHVAAADPHPLYALESALGNAAGKNVGTTAGTVAAGDDARLPTALEKTRLSDIQAATGATTALKLANLTSPATTTQQGVITKVTNAAEVTTGTSANAITPATLKDSTPPLNGIKFPATQVPSADANTLDDYEEGSCTLAVAGTTTAGTHTYTVKVGNYTKVGRRVSVDFTLAISSKDVGMAGNVIISGLPFATSSVTNYVAGLSIGYLNGHTLTANFTEIIGRVVSTVTSISLFEIGSGQSTTALAVAKLGATPSIQGTISYNV